eukprot:TRINITY_DN689_c0_g3_i1.p1 TRINITY_DN689_c0_g3~~TRINITY_DN689_c0_g3_i1.p1  ORF type:complete len:186 (+),score=75.89 TRINITY_DN689_c0_g3_i1:59-559(+)
MASMQFDTEVCTACADASQTYPMRAGLLRKGSFVMIEGRPMKLSELSVSKLGKHGHCKVLMTGIDMFTSRKAEHATTTAHNVDVPVVSRTLYTVCDADEDDNTCSLMDEAGSMHYDYNLPSPRDATSKEVREKMVRAVEKGMELRVTVVQAMGEYKIVEPKWIRED